MKSIYLIICIVFFITCNENIKIRTPQYVPDKKLVQIVDSFIKDSKCENNIHEIYIDKLDPHNFQIIIYQGNHSLTKQENKDFEQESLLSSSFRGIDFRIYSGVERYFKITKNKIPNDTICNKTNSSNLNCENLWFVKDSFGVFIIKPYKNEIYPFMPLPLWPDTIPPNEK